MSNARLIEEARQWADGPNNQYGDSTLVAQLADALEASDAEREWAEYDLRFVRRFPVQCTEAVSRKGEVQPCDKPAVAVRIDPEEGNAYPVCAYHARADMVPLRVLMEGDR